MSTSTNNHMFNLLHAPPSRLYVTPKREVGGAGVQKGGSAGKRKKPRNLGVGWINRVMFPISKFTIKNYGENFYGLTMGSSRLTRAGTLKRLAGEPMKQYWFEGYGLPLYQPVVGSNSNLQGSVPSICSLLDLCWHAANNKVVDTYTSDLAGSNALSAASSGPTTIAYARLLNKKVAYLGGFQKHTFVNVSNAHQFMEIYELHPRDVMFDWTVSSNNLKFRSVGDDVLKDYATNAATTTSLATTQNAIDLTPTDLRYDDVNDPLVTINSRCRIVHAKWKVSKPLKVALAPGETFHYTMRFDPFTFEEGELNKYLESVYYSSDTVTSNDYTRPTSIPLFTKRLVVRAWGEIGHSTITVNKDVTTTTLTSTQIAANKEQPTYVANTQANLLHLQEEQHSVRYVPEANTRRDIMIDERDQAANNVAAAWQMEVMNEEIDGEEVVDV